MHLLMRTSWLLHTQYLLLLLSQELLLRKDCSTMNVDPFAERTSLEAPKRRISLHDSL